jgi:hypothetical protein
VDQTAQLLYKVLDFFVPDFSHLWPGKTVAIGGGRFGRLSLERLAGRVALVVEPEPGPELMGTKVPTWREDGVRAAVEMLESGSPPKYLIPTLPVHLFSRWLLANLTDLQPKQLSFTDNDLLSLQCNIHSIDNVYYVSLADFICPDDCPEPAEICTVTGKPRGTPLFRRMAKLGALGYKTAVLRSRQLAPGIGGILSADMLTFKDAIRQSPGRWIVATACRCHGVLELIDFSKLQCG